MNRIFIPVIFLIELTACTHFLSKKSSKQLFTLENPPNWGRTSNGESINAGGFSSLIYLGKNPQNQELQFLTNSDRGPNGEPIPDLKKGKDKRPFLLPEFQVRLAKLETDHKNMTLKIIEEIILTDPFGKPLPGIPQLQSEKLKWADELPVDLTDKIILPELMGIDPESICIDADGNFWIGEEYRPSLLKFNPQGRLLKRYIPQNSLPIDTVTKVNKAYGQNIIVAKLPEAYKYRKSNRGFEGIAFLNNKIYAILQSPLELPNAVQQKNIHLLEFDLKTESVTNVFLYPLTHDKIDKIGDLAVRPNSSEFFAIEQNSTIDRDGTHLITSFFLPTNSKSINPELKKTTVPKSPDFLLDVETRLDLNSVGYGFAEKVEGLTFLSENQLAVINDNDFGVTEELHQGLKKLTISNSKKTRLGIFSLDHNSK